jgi:hypothetical protein
VFVNSRPVSLDAGRSVLDAVRAADPGWADAVKAGFAFVTDGVGRRIEAGEPIVAGTILRVIKTAGERDTGT